MSRRRPPSPSRRRARPDTVKIGSVTVRIYRTTNRGSDLFTVSYYDAQGRRRRRNFRDGESARLEAQRVAASISRGESQVLQLTGDDRLAYERAVRTLEPLGRPIELVASEYVDATRILAGRASITEAARFFSRHASRPIRSIPLPDVLDEFLRQLALNHRSKRHIQDCRSRLRRLAAGFPGPIGDIPGAELQDWVNGLDVSPRTRNNFRASIVSLFHFARGRGYLAEERSTAADTITKASDRGSAIGVFSPEEMARILGSAAPSLVPYLAIGAFAGLRQAEIRRLDWSDVHLDREFIEVRAAIAKTASRRLAPIPQNLSAWLGPHARTRGRVCGSNVHKKAPQHATSLGITWPHNGLRHSFASYRLAQCQDAPRVALEMGSSPAMIFRHYRELVTGDDAAAWWAISPAPAENVVPMSAAGRSRDPRR